MISFEPTDDQKLMVDSVAQFARTTLRPRFRDHERERALPETVRNQAHELGLGLVAIPEHVGGAGLGLTTAALLEEEVAWGDPGAAFGFGGPGAFGLAVTELGTTEQAQAALASFAEADGGARFGAVAWGEPKAHPTRPGLVATATHDGAGYRLRGTKAYVVNADRSERFVVFAQIDESKGWRGIAAFLVDKNAKGLSIAPRDTTLGLDIASFGGITLDDVSVPESARLAGNGDFDAALMRFFARQALLVAARGVGLSRAAFETTREYVDTRKAFGKPIGHFQAVAFTVADRAMDVEAGRGMVWRAAAAWDSFDRGRWSAASVDDKPQDERTCLLRTAEAVAFVHEAAMRCGDTAVQLHGGAGFIRDTMVEKHMRDAKQLGLCAMTATQADQLAAQITLGQAVDPAVVLPSAETQNAFL